MYLLYLDESGDPNNASENHFVLAGIAVYETDGYWISKRVDSIEASLFPEQETSPPKEFHASEIARGAKPPWDQLEPAEREEILNSLCSAIIDSNEKTLLFGTAIHRASFASGDLISMAFEDITSRFDLFLKRKYAMGDKQRGLMILDKNREERRLQTLLNAYRKEGGRFGRLVNFADVPFFTDSASSRLIQLAD